MSSQKIENMLSNRLKDEIPVPRKQIKVVKVDRLTEKLRGFDNIELMLPLPNQSGVYINTNEKGVSNLMMALCKQPLIAEAFHVGFSGWHNFDIMAQRRSSRALICDINPENALFLYYALKYIRRHNNRFEFIKAMTLFVKNHTYEGTRTNAYRESLLGKVSPKSIKFCLNVSEEYPYAEHFTVLEEIGLELKRETSWLYDDARYAHIRNLAVNDKIALITESICETQTFFAISRVLRDNSVQIDTLYVSNISEWMFTPAVRNSFIQTVQLFMSDNQTILIDAQINSFEENPIPTQRCTSKQLLAERTLEHWFFSDSKQIKPEQVMSNNKASLPVSSK